MHHQAIVVPPCSFYRQGGRLPGACTVTVPQVAAYTDDHTARFDSDRWTPEHEAKLPHDAYLPFGVGPHSSPGKHVAMMEAQFVLATLVQRVTFALVQGQRIEPEPLITLLPKSGIRVMVRR